MNGDPETDLLNAIRRQENANPKYNNPGNLKPSGFTYEGQTGLDPSGIAIFDSPESGEKALRQQIRKNAGRGLTLKEFFGGGKGYPGYAPKADKNDPETYAANVASWTGIDPDTPLDKIMPQDYDSMSVEQLQKLAQEEQSKLDALKAQRASKGIIGGMGNVQAPPSGGGGIGGAITDWAKSGFGTIPAYEQGKRAFTDPDWRDKASDIIEAGGHLGPAIAAGSLAAAPFTGGLSALAEEGISLVAAYGASKGASMLADSLGGYANLDPKTRRLVDDLAGLGGGIAGYKGGVPAAKLGTRAGYKVGTSPVTGGAAAGGLAHMLGIPGLPTWAAAVFGRKLLPSAVEAMTPEWLKNWSGINKPAPKAPVSPPPSPAPSNIPASAPSPAAKAKPNKIFVDPTYDKLAAEGHLPLDEYEQHLRDNDVPENVIQAKLRKAKIAQAEEVAKNAPPPVTLQPKPPPNPPPTPDQGFLPGMEPPGPVTPSMPPTNVTLPPTVQAVRANGQPMGRQLQLPINGGPPEQLPLPGTNVLQPNAPQPPLGGPVQQSLPFPEPPRAAPPYQPELPFNARPQDPNQMQLPFDAQRTPVRPPTLQLPGQGPGPALPTVRAPGSEVNPANIQRQLPFGRGAIRQDMPTEQHAAKIADLAAEFRRAPPKPTNRMSILRWLKRLDFIPSEQEWIRGKEIYQSRKVGEGARSRMP